MRKKIGEILRLEGFRYICSSAFAFLISYILTQIVYALLPAWGGKFHLTQVRLEIATTVGWLVSSHVNFFVNRSLVFRSHAPVRTAYLKYYALALPVFLVKNFGFVELLCRFLRLGLAVAMPVSELLMFVVTYIVQKKFIFRRRKKHSYRSDEDVNCSK